MDQADHGSAGTVPATSSMPQSLQQSQKLGVYLEVLRRLKNSNNDKAMQPDFDHQLSGHFNRLPTRFIPYLMEIQLTPSIQMHLGKKHVKPLQSTQGAFILLLLVLLLILKPWHLKLINLKQPSMHGSAKYSQLSPCMKSPFLQMTSLSFSVREAHVFSTTDGYSLDVFVVDGWPYEETQQLKEALEKEVLLIERHAFRAKKSEFYVDKTDEVEMKCEEGHFVIPNDGSDVWEIEPKHLKYGNKIASRSFGELFRGTYCSQDVAIKVLKAEDVSSDWKKEFTQEVYITRLSRILVLLD